ncbi:MAG: hypothetical protein HRU18_03045 [Pseudoalteromonas sp.]|uniref:hypothetical protein n=1 Tax=Pseudoalteromonas sp. TaxID=53249 RepID=UPI001DE7417C|nr:hypothetical protein [Pseudoalteromonas sp.]NRA77161.1 hypothetical protein [Pseudoalteromonas sp.]
MIAAYEFPNGAKQMAIDAVMGTLYDNYREASTIAIRKLIERNAVLSNDNNTEGFWYKQNTYGWFAHTPRYKIQIPLHLDLHDEMEGVFQEERTINLEKDMMRHWLVTTLNYCRNPIDVKIVIPSYIYDLMSDHVKEKMLVTSQSILNQTYCKCAASKQALACEEAAKLRIMLNSLLG